MKNPFFTIINDRYERRTHSREDNVDMIQKSCTDKVITSRECQKGIQIFLELVKIQFTCDVSVILAFNEAMAQIYVP